MGGGTTKKLDRGTGDKGLAYEEPTLGSEKRIDQLLTMPVPAGSTRRRDELTGFFNSISMTEAARLHSKLSNPYDKQRQRMERQLSRSTVPKLLDILQARSGRQVARPVPERMTTEAAKSEFLGITEKPLAPAKNRTTAEDVYDEARAAELYGELARRGEAYSRPAPQTQRQIDSDFQLHQATQKYNYTGIDYDTLKKNFERPPVNLLGGRSQGYFRILEEMSNGELYDIGEDSIRQMLPKMVGYTGPETIAAPYVNKNQKILAIRYPTKTVLVTGETKVHVWEIWWFADGKNEFNALLGHAEMASRFNPSPEARFFVGGDLEGSLRVQLGVLMRPIMGDSMIFEQMTREWIGSVTSGITHPMADRRANRIQGGKGGGKGGSGRRGGGVGGGDDDTSLPGKTGASQRGRFAHLENATPDKVAAALRDPEAFLTYKKSLGKTDAAAEAAADVQALGKAVAKHTSKSGTTLKMDKAVGEAVWALPEHMRGVLIEHTLAETQYKGWFRAGQLDRGYFPDIDFAITTGPNGPQLRASVKTANTFAKGYEQQLNETLPAHVETIVTATKNDIAAGRRPATTTIDIRVPPGSAIPKAELAQTLRDHVPKDVQKYVKIVVNEF